MLSHFSIHSLQEIAVGRRSHCRQQHGRDAQLHSRLASIESQPRLCTISIPIVDYLSVTHVF